MDWLGAPSLDLTRPQAERDHMRLVAMGYHEIVLYVYRWTEAASPGRAHDMAMYFMALDANPA